MLVLSRKLNEKIHLHMEAPGGERFIGTIAVTGVRSGGRIQIGLDLAKDVRISRAEVDQNPPEEHAS